jgi:uncharacterized protein (TIGR02145 family)
MVAIIQVYISSGFSTTGTVQSAYPGVNQNFVVNPGIVTQLTLPSGVVLQDGIENKGIHITANDPITVYGLNNWSATTDAFMALPVNALGTDYRTLSYKTTFNNMGSCFSVVATQDATNLTIYNHQTSSTTNVTLNTGQTYHVEATVLNEDLTGSRIQSNFPVAVFGSNDICQVPLGCIAADHLVEQMFPYYSWGKNFVTVPLAGRDNSGDIFRILAAEDATIISINGTVVTTINAGDHYETVLTGYNSINTSKATMVAQFAKGQGCSGGTIGDPFMMLLLPREQYLTNYTIINVAGVTPFNSHWVNLMAPDYALGTIYEDGILVPTSAFVQISTTNYYGAQRSVTQGSHTYTSTFPFGVSVYGWRTVDSYGYPGGGSMSPVGTIDSISLSPDTLYGDLNVTVLCLTARVLDNLNNPVEGVLVNFNVSGVNPLTGNGYTNASGDAQFCYTQTGTASCVDHVYAEVFNILSDTSVVFWNYQCDDPLNGGEIGSTQSGCGSFTPQALTNIVSPSGQAGTLEYKWQQSVTDAGAGFTDIPGSNSPGYAPGSLIQTTWFRRLARVSCKSDWNTAAVSNVLKMTVITPLPVSVTVIASDNEVCANTQVTFTATPTNGGVNPVYQWKVNGVNAGTNNAVFTYIPVNGDLVSCILNSSEVCTTNNPASSNSITLIVDPLLLVSVTVTASANPVCQGTAVSFTATPVNGGTNPVYQWRVNAVNAGTNNTVFTYVPVNGDLVSCVLTSSEQCTTNNPASSNQCPVSVLQVPNVTFTSCFDTVTTLNAKPIKLKGGIPPGGTFSGSGVNSVTGIFTPASAGIGLKTISYSYTNVNLCSAGTAKTILVQSPPVFTCGNNLTDIRDNKVYPTVLIGTQCWMAANLDYGVEILSSQHQRDNCIPEKYLQPPPGFPQQGEGCVYQWDELMCYDDAQGLQGLCPPGWHVPAETEWNTLFANWTNNAFAGAPLKYSGYSGFNAQLSGVWHQNIQWDYADVAAFFWSSTAHGPDKAWGHGMNDYDPSVSLYPSLRSNAFPVRCLKD